MNSRVLVCIPTYCESENIARLVEEIFSLEIPGLEILIADDASPDNTATIAENLRDRYPLLTILKRKPPYGRGAAGRDLFLYALEKNFDAAIEMDADFSHDPNSIPQLLKALGNSELVIGSRFVQGGSDSQRPKRRQILTRWANFYARSLLRISVQDTNSGYRAWSRKALEVIEPQTLRAQGPAIVHEALYRAARKKIRIQEIPIRFVDRKLGFSKLNLGKLAYGYFWVLRLAVLGK
jgi:dolichol-phosphate mannosyltransferase